MNNTISLSVRLPSGTNETCDHRIAFSKRTKSHRQLGPRAWPHTVSVPVSCADINRVHSHYLLFGRAMRLPLDIIYRPPSKEQSYQAFVAEIREQLHRAYDTARDRLYLALQRQQDYYDRRTQGERFRVGDSVWLWSPVLEKGMAPKIHEPWTGPVKISKRISDVTYEVLIS